MFAKLKKKLQDENGLPSGILSQVSGQNSNNNSSASYVSVSSPSSLINNDGHQALIHHHGVSHQNSQERTAATSSSSSSSTTSRKTSSSDDVMTTPCALLKTSKSSNSQTREFSSRPDGDLHSKLKELAEKLEERDKTIASLEVALENQQIASSKELRVLNKHFQEERSRVGELVANAVAVKEEELRAELQSQETSPKERDVDFKDSYSNIDESRSRLKDAMDTIASLQLKLKEKQNSTEQASRADHFADDWLEKQIESEKMISHLESELAVHKKKLQDSESEKRTLLRSVESKNSELSEASVQIASLKLQLETEKHRFESCKDELNEKVVRLKDSVNDKEVVRLEAEKLQREKQRLEEEIEAAKRELITAEDRHVGETLQLRESVGNLVREKNELNEEILKLKEEVSQTEAEVTERTKKSMEEAEEMIKDKNKVIKKQEQRLGDLKKLLHKEIAFKRLGHHHSATNNYHSNGSHNNFNNSNIAYDPLLASSFDMEEAYFNNSSDAEMADAAAAQLKISSSMTCLSTRRESRTSHENVDLSDDLNFKYLKHVVLKFLLSREHEALQLIKVVSMLLKFTPDEEKMIKDTLKWKTSWFRAKPTLPEKGQSAIVVPALY